MTRQERMEYIAEEMARESIKFMMKKKSNTYAYHSYVYVNGKRFDIDVVYKPKTDLKGGDT